MKKWGEYGGAAVEEGVDEDGRALPPFQPPAHWKAYDYVDRAVWEVEPLVPIVVGIIAKGNLVLGVAETQTGKTLWGLDLAVRLLVGGKLFGRYEVNPVAGVLYLGMEDPGRRFKDRLLDMEHEYGAEPPRGALIFRFASGFSLQNEEMFRWLEREIVDSGRDVVFLDTYQKATPGLASYDDATQSKILHKLAEMTRLLGVTLIVFDHFRKRGGNDHGQSEASIEDIKGTQGKPANADCVILMQRTADKKQIKFQSFSKDFDEPVRILLNVAPKGSAEPKFTYAGDLEALGANSKEKAEERRQQVLAVMKPGQWYGRSDLAKLTGFSESSIKRYMKTLQEDGSIDHNKKGGHACMYWRSDQ